MIDEKTGTYLPFDKLNAEAYNQMINELDSMTINYENAKTEQLRLEAEIKLHQKRDENFRVQLLQVIDILKEVGFLNGAESKKRGLDLLKTSMTLHYGKDAFKKPSWYK